MLQRAETTTGEIVAWMKLHEGDKKVPIVWNTLRTWHYISKAEANHMKAVMEEWRIHEEKQGRITKAARAKRDLERQWEQHEQRECYTYGAYNAYDPYPAEVDYRMETMSQPVLRSGRGWR